jgi:hypothetical protein
MVRYGLALLLSLWSVSPVLAGSWAENLFEEQSRDFGSVPRGPTLSYPFRLTNKTNQDVHLASVRVSCGCLSASAMKNELAPGQSTAIVAQMDTSRFLGTRTVTIYVQFDRPRWEEVRLSVRANSRDDVMITPEAFAFGQVKRGASPAATLEVSFLGASQWQILESQCESNYVQTSLKEVKRDGGEVRYQLTARLRPDTPVGKWFSDVWLKTNSSSSPRVRVPLTVEVESALSLSPANVALGQVKAGDEAKQKLIVRSDQPFRITGIDGTDAQLMVREVNADNKTVHVLAVTLKGADPGELTKVLRVRTDLKGDNEIEFQATAQVVP